MNDNNHPTNDDLAETLHQQFRLSTPADVKADLLYHCGVAAGESNFQRRRWKNNWMMAAAIFLAFGVGGLGGWYSNIPAVQNRIANSNQAEDLATDRKLTTPESGRPTIGLQQPTIKRPENALTAAMDFNQARRALSQMQPPIGNSSIGSETSPRPLSVWMSASDLDQLLSLRP